MKKTVTVNLGGIVFHIDEDAYFKLKNYLDTISQYYGNEEEAEEIISDIEVRISELLSESKGQMVVTIKDIDNIIEIMGCPEDVTGSESTDDFNSSNESYDSNKSKSKKLYRDDNSRILGGVCGGIAAYFGVDPVLVRIVFLILIIPAGFGILPYIILWIIMPLAKTRQQRMEMRGEPINVDNIEKNIKKEYQEVKKSFNKIKNSKEVENMRNAFKKKSVSQTSSSFFSFLGEIISTFFNVLGRFLTLVFGIVFSLVGVICIIAITFSLLFGHDIMLFDFDFFNHNILPTDNTLFTNRWFFYTASCLLIFIPLIALLMGGIRLLFKTRISNKGVNISIFLVWIISLFVVIMGTTSTGRYFNVEAQKVDEFKLKEFKGNTLYVKVKELDKEMLGDKKVSFENWKLYKNNNTISLLIKPDINIYRGQEKDFSIKLIKESRGLDQEDAYESATKIKYFWEQQDSVLFIDPYYIIDKDTKFRFQDLDIIIKAPQGKKVDIDDPNRRMNYRGIFRSKYKMYGNSNDNAYDIRDEDFE